LLRLRLRPALVVDQVPTDLLQARPAAEVLVGRRKGLLPLVAGRLFLFLPLPAGGRLEVEDPLLIGLAATATLDVPLPGAGGEDGDEVEREPGPGLLEVVVRLAPAAGAEEPAAVYRGGQAA